CPLCALPGRLGRASEIPKAAVANATRTLGFSIRLSHFRDGGFSQQNMGSSEIESRLNSLVERLAAVEHERWSHWQRYMHDQGERLQDGSLRIPAELVARWETQITRPYVQLT